jgi:hypothetical protein
VIRKGAWKNGGVMIIREGRQTNQHDVDVAKVKALGDRLAGASSGAFRTDLLWALKGVGK